MPSPSAELIAAIRDLRICGTDDAEISERLRVDVEIVEFVNEHGTLPDLELPILWRADPVPRQPAPTQPSPTRISNR